MEIKSVDKLRAMHEFIVENWDKIQVPKIAQIIGVSEAAYRKYIYALGFKQQVQICWSEKDKQFLIDAYKTTGDVEIGKKVGRNRQSVYSKRKQLKLKRTKVQMRKIAAARHQVRILDPNYKHPRKKHAGEKWKVKGCRYWQTKNNDGEILPLHRHIWEWEFGEVPDGFKVVFKDDDVDNLNPDNLDLISYGDMAKYNRLISSRTNKEAQSMSFVERIMSGMIPHQTKKLTIYK